MVSSRPGKAVSVVGMGLDPSCPIAVEIERGQGTLGCAGEVVWSVKQREAR